jgi:hypothetical protein
MRDRGGYFSDRRHYSGGPLALAVATALWFTAAPAEATFGYRRSITINAGQVAGGPQTDFPVLVNVTNGTLRTVGNGGRVVSGLGSDIQFRASDGVTVLAHEIERYDGVNGTLVAWVRIPSLADGTVFYLYYGDPQAGCSLANPGNVWDANFRSVYHLNSTALFIATTGEMRDSTTNHQDAVNGGTADIAGQIGRGRDVSLSPRDVILTNHSESISQFTASAWVRWNGTASVTDGGTGTDFPRILDKRAAGGTGLTEKSLFINNLAGTDTIGRLRYDAGANGFWRYNYILPAATWVHVAIVDDETTAGPPTLYVNGVAQTLSASTVRTAPQPTIEPFSYGNNPALTRSLDGRIDEIRTSNTLRSGNWILTEYRNQSAPGTFYALGAEAVAPVVLAGGCPAAGSMGKDGNLTVAAAGTIVNKYGTLTSDAARGATSFSVTNPGGANALDPATLTAGDLLLVIQMQGATIDTSDAAVYGTVTNLNNAGLYEFVTVASVAGTTVNLSCSRGLINSYTAAGHVQVIRVPQYANLVLTGSVTAPAWNSTAQFYGGIVAIRAETLDMSGSITVSGLGFAGAIGVNAGAAGGGSVVYRTATIADGAPKGEGVAGNVATYDGLNGRYGRGAPANGGGGGNGTNAGGGGGANGHNGVTWDGQGNTNAAAGWGLETPSLTSHTASGGGRGGYSFSTSNQNANTTAPGNALWAGDMRRQVGGLGGRPLPNDAASRVFMGGGGGAGHGDDGVAGSGGNGGGIVFVLSRSIRDTGAGQVLANGAAGTDGGTDDGAGGGGGGGSIVLNALSTLLDLDLQANGGVGGADTLNTPANHAHGPGGGGGGGFIAVFSPLQDPLTRTAGGGTNGTSASTAVAGELTQNGATSGGAGLSLQPSVTMPGGCINTAVVGSGCPAGTYLSGANLVQNATFATGAGAGPGFAAGAQFTASVANAGDGNCPADTQVAVRSGNITCGALASQLSFPGDPSFGVAAAAGFLHANGNTTGSTYTTWQQTVAGLTPGATYSFAAYASNVVAPGIPCFCVDEPRIVFRRDGTAVSNMLPVSYELVEQGDTWQRFQTTFTASAASHVLAVADAATSATGDDLGLTNLDVRLCAAVTAVELMAFEARPGDGRVELVWQTGSETKNLGFNVYRAASADGPYVRITSALIPGLGSSPEGARYSYVDTAVANGETYHYKLEDVETTGRTQMHGPVSATPRAGSAPGANDPGDEGAAPAAPRTAYGDPSGTSLRILERSDRHVVVQLRTGGFFGTRLTDGSVRVEVPSFQETSEPGQPGIPTRRAWIEGVAGSSVEITSIRADDVLAFALRPEDAPGRELDIRADGTVRLARRRARVRTESRSLFPPAEARILTTAFQEEIKKVELDLAPLRYDAARGRLWLAKTLTVRLAFRGGVADERLSGRGRGRKPPRFSRGQDVLARLAVKESGLHVVSFEEIFAATARPLSASQMQLSRQGAAVPFHLEPDNGRFGPGSTLIFVSAGASLNPYAQEAVYELVRTSASGPQMPTASAAPTGVVVASYVQERRSEINRIYQAALVDAPDLWLWDYIVAPANKAYPFTMTDPAASGLARLTVVFQGGSDFPAHPDHHVRLRVNGTVVGEASWDGKLARTVEADVAAALLRNGENSLEIENVGDTGAAYSLVMLNRFSLTHSRATIAEAGHLEGLFESQGTATVAGLAAGAYIADVSGPTPRWLTGAVTTPQGLAFRVEAGRRYVAAARDAAFRPRVTKPAAASLRSKLNQADYLVITPREFLEAAAPLLDHRRAQGLASRSVAIEDIYAEFGFGEATPHALKEFLAYAYHEWSSPSPRYVLLLGDANYDAKDYLKTGIADRIPGMMVKTPFIWTISDPLYAAVNGDDTLPDLALGRLSAATLAEAHALVRKVLAFERGGFALAGPRVLVADNADNGGNFERDAEEIAAGPLGGRAEKIYIGALGGGTRAAIHDAFDRGASVVSYVGHGSTVVWASENVFNNMDLPTLAAQPQQPLLFTMNCLNGYFHMPGMSSLAEAFVKVEERGAVAAFAPSGMSMNDAAHVYHRAALEEVLSGRHARLGDALLAAQARYTEAGAMPELLGLYHLLGDPALQLR